MSHVHPTVIKEVIQLRNWIEEYKVKKYFEDDIIEKENRIHELYRLWGKFKENPLIQKMSTIVDKKVEHYHQDFFYHDLRLIEDYEGDRFAWYVGDCGTHIIWLDNFTEEKEQSQQEHLKAVQNNYGRYDLYECNLTTHQFRKMKYENLSFRRIKKQNILQEGV